MNISWRVPSLLPIFLKMMAGSPKDKPAQTLAQFKMSMPAADYAVLEEQPGRVESLVQMTRESMVQGTKRAV